MARPKKDLTGQRFGRLVVLEDVRIDTKHASVWRCVCDCGNEKLVGANNLARGKTRSCGCLQKEYRLTYNVRAWSDSKDQKEGTRLSSLTAKINSKNKSGVKGVCWNKKKGTWLAQMQFKGETVLMQNYKSLDDAVAARQAAEDKYFRPILEKYKDER